MVYHAECPPKGHCKSVIKALIMASNWHEEDAGAFKVGSHRRVYGGLRSRIREELAGQWKAWSVCDWPIKAVNWADVKGNIVGCIAGYERPVENIRSLAHADGL